MSEKLTSQNVEELAARVCEWVASPEGQKALREAEERVQRMIEEWHEAERINWHILYRPMTI